MVTLTSQGEIFRGQSWCRTVRKGARERCVCVDVCVCWAMGALPSVEGTSPSWPAVILFLFFKVFLEFPKPLWHYHLLLFLNYFPSNSGCFLGVSQLSSSQSQHGVLGVVLLKVFSVDQQCYLGIC